eukprot:4135368-Pyramimonas_sp.AAC.1
MSRLVGGAGGAAGAERGGGVGAASRGDAREEGGRAVPQDAERPRQAARVGQPARHPRRARLPPGGGDRGRDRVRQDHAGAAVHLGPRGAQRRRRPLLLGVHAAAPHQRHQRGGARRGGARGAARADGGLPDPAGERAQRGDPADVLHHRRAAPPAQRGREARRSQPHRRGRGARAVAGLGLPVSAPAGAAAEAAGPEGGADVRHAGRGQLQRLLQRGRRPQDTRLHPPGAGVLFGGLPAHHKLQAGALQ